ncbi:YitT family protein [Paenibacillus sp. J2TS4]|uniref:YitT family protein n=1 Tax=Paenibacillus sp. J2TS4 TaxID=2807194 RepID=UPI001B1368EC|nr:YitT family protein [Paenibacillus sp. J2TS4]GIP35620.1 membrane protein [Paenibacillus sp. J2TS4]
MKINKDRGKSAILPAASPIKEYLLLLIGAFIMAVSFNVFLNPNQIASGGVTGISTIIQHLIGIKPAFIQWVLNLLLFAAGVKFLGKDFAYKTAVGTVVFPLFVLLTEGMPVPTENVLLASLYGGILTGIGLGIVFKARGSTGGLALASQLIHRYTGISLGVAVAMLDGLVILTAGLVFSPEKALYALIGLYVTSKTIDLIQSGINFSKVAFIISKETDTISQAVLVDLNRGLTKLNGLGGYTGDERVVLMIVLNQSEVSRLKSIVKTVDPNAFVIISDTKEVLGEGFQVNQ